MTHAVLGCSVEELHCTKVKKKQFESKKGNLKKFLHDLNTLESEAKRLKEVMDSEVRSFSNVIKPHLIRSNLSKYFDQFEWNNFASNQDNQH